jgi:MFS transporter, SET family, sugar efflux transporter
MMTNTFPIGQILAAPAFGLAQQFGFRLAYGLNLALCLLGLVLILVARSSGKRTVPDSFEPGTVSNGVTAGSA